MSLPHLTKLFRRDLNRLRNEIAAYPSESDLWIVDQQINNSAGNLALHLSGNLNHFIGHALGGSDYKRDREFEFAGKNVSREHLLQQIESAKEMISDSLSKLSEEDLRSDFPIQVFDRPVSTGFFLLHLQGHLNYHLGQINYHRRLLTRAE